MNFSRKQKPSKQVQSLLLEIQHKKWESSQRNSLFILRQWHKDPWHRDTYRERKCRCPPQEKEYTGEGVQITYLGQFFQVFLCLWPMISLLFPHLTCPSSLSHMPRWNPAQRPSGIGGYALEQRVFSCIFGWVCWCKIRWKSERNPLNN